MSDDAKPFINPKDPLLKSGPDQQRELFNGFTRAANGFSTEEVIGAAANLMVNALRQAHGSRQKAEQAFDALFGKTKQLLVDHYDGQGKRRSVFPFHQTIQVGHFTDTDGFKH